ncbi:TetR/AcrR family transcriptional regulator [Kibdelosporangium persicum]|uniref:HTH-type transcriptional regulator tcmR n=1 Tax=Kibdelosporangium persicum TaxID=2698649 RepID=A0ABX2FIM8_9PSEU|nr:TetR/AcrR family transcriptional regulator [Kibdelosporangium persicum]NRN71262.1 HTH-type transcriptional regulator tcmR [Kibdelosporangium persicum]
MPHDQKTPVRTGRPPLTERRKAETRLEVARAAVRLFLANGVAGTSAEDIAAAAGISSRTLWRYFPTKDSCVKPLLTGGIEHTARCLRSWRRDQGVTDLLDMMREQAAGTVNDIATDRTALLNLVRLTRTEPGLRAVWLEAHREAEPVFAEALAQRAGLPGPDLAVTVQAAMINTALRVAVEHESFTTDPAEAETAGYPEAAVYEALLIAARGFPS